MADQKISQLNELTSPLSGDTLPIVNNNETKKITISNLLSGSNVQPYFISTDTGSIENFKVGDNVWLGDNGTANTLVVKGVNDAGSGFIRFGASEVHQNPYIGHESNEDANVLSIVADTTKIVNAVIIGSGSLVAGDPEMIHVYSSGSFNIANFIGNTQTYSQINVKNTSGASGASSDIVATADNGNEETHYVNMGINSSGFDNEFSIGYQNDAYVYNAGQDLYVGVMEAASPSHGHLHLFSQGLWETPSINIVESGSVAFGTGSVTDGFNFEFSGSVKFNDSVNIGSVLSLNSSDPLPSGTLGSLAVSGSNIYFHNGSSWKTMLLEPNNNVSVNNTNGVTVNDITVSGITFNGSFPLLSGNTISGIGTITNGDSILIQFNDSNNFKVEFFVNESMTLDTSGTGPASVNITSNFTVLSTDELEIRITTY